jgi:Flp pilus assembly protein TadD
MGLVFAKMGSYGQALSNLDRAIQINGDNAEAWNVKGLIYKEQGLISEAVSCFERAVAIDPSRAEFKNNLREASEAVGANSTENATESATGNAASIVTME